ncbi:MAG: NAD(P)-dependent oxidoreductase, partial [Mycoplasmatales bacterium]
TLTIMCGGDQELFDFVKPIFEVMGQTIVLQGAPGAGQHTKMCNQISLAANMVGVMEYIAYAKMTGLDAKRVMESIGNGSAQSTAMNVYAHRIFNGDLEPGFYIKHFVKDLKIAIEECEVQNIKLPGLLLAHNLYKTLEEEGLGQLGTQALIKYYEGESNE